jgi:DNA end-binding protein Ku
MAARSIASLTVSFGLVSIPVKLYSATEASRAISFNLLHKSCGSRLRQQYMCIKEEVPVAREDMVKGYEFAKDQYVIFSPEELKALEEAGTQMAEITEFVPIDAVDPVYFDKAYYLAPDKGGAKPYALLASALRESKRCALGRWAARGKQYIVMIRPIQDGLMMQQLLYATEVRSIKDIDVQKADVKDAELKLAQQLIDQLNQLIPADQPKLKAPDLKFNRSIGEYVGKPFSVTGELLSAEAFQMHQQKTLPTAEDEKILADIIKNKDWVSQIQLN